MSVGNRKPCDSVFGVASSSNRHWIGGPNSALCQSLDWRNFHAMQQTFFMNFRLKLRRASGETGWTDFPKAKIRTNLCGSTPYLNFHGKTNPVVRFIPGVPLGLGILP